MIANLILIVVVLGVAFAIIRRFITKRQNEESDEKMQAFKELVATRYEAKKYLPDDFDPDAELEAARKERYDSID